MYQNGQGGHYRTRESALSSAGRTISGMNNQDGYANNYGYGSPGKPNKFDNYGYGGGRNSRGRDVDYDALSYQNQRSYAPYGDKANQARYQSDNQTNYLLAAKDKIAKTQHNLDNLQRAHEKQLREAKDYIAQQRHMVREYDPLQQMRRNMSTRVLPDEDEKVNQTGSMLDDYVSGQGLDDNLRDVAPFDPPGPNKYKPQNYNRNTYDYAPNYGFNQNSFVGSPYANYPPPMVNPYAQQNSYYPLPQTNPNVSVNIPPQNDALQSRIERQQNLLEEISRKLDGEKYGKRDDYDRYNGARRSIDSRHLEKRLKEMEKESDLKIQLMKQQQMIENLMNGHYRNNSNGGMNPVYDPSNPYGVRAGMADPKDKIIEQQQSLLSNIFMQTMNQQQASGQMPYYYYPYYAAQDDGQGYGQDPFAYMYADAKKKKKKKKKKHGESDSDQKSDDDNDDDDYYESKKKKKKDKDADKSKSKKKKSNPEEERKKKEEARKRVKTIAWSMIYPVVLVHDVRIKVAERKKFQAGQLDDNVTVALQNMLTYILNTCQDAFVGLFSENNKSYDFIGTTGKSPSEKEKRARGELVMNRITSILETLNKGTDSNPIDMKTIDFLATISLGGNYAPNFILAPFEIKRLDFNIYGRIENMNKDKSCMILACTILNRMLVYQLILRADEWNGKIKWTPQVKLNMTIIGSVIYRLIHDIYATRLPIINPDVQQVNVKALPPLTLGGSPPTDNDPNTEEMIEGMYTQADMSHLFLNPNYRTWYFVYYFLMRKGGEYQSFDYRLV